MKKAVDIIKKINLRGILALAAVLFVFSVSEAAAVNCGKKGQTCGEGQKCIKCVSISSGDFQSYSNSVTEHFRCVEAGKEASNFNSFGKSCADAPAGGFNSVGLSSAAGYHTVISEDPCKTSCLPKCYYKALRECTLCGLFKIAFNTSSKIAYHSIKTFSGSVLQVVIIAFAIWIAIKILAFVSSPETRDFKDLAQSLLTQGFIVIIVVVLLRTGAMSFFNLALDPIYSTGMNIAQKTISIDDVAAGTTAKEKGLEVEDWEFTCTNDPEILTEKTGGALPPSMGNGIICTMTMIQNRAAKIKALASAAICKSWEEKAFIIPHLGYLLTGLGLWIGAMILIIAVPFLMLDAVIELAVAAALLPAAIGAYAFKITRRYVKPVWDTFMNSMFAFMFVSLIALMLTVAFEQILSEATKGSLDALLDEGATEATLRTVLQDMAWWTVAFLKICFVLVLTWTVMGEAKEFAGQFSSSLSNTAIGSAVGAMGMSAGKSAVKKVAAPTLEAMTDTGVEWTKSAARGTAHVFRRSTMDRRFNKAVDQGSVYTGSEFANGTTSYTYKSKSWFRRREVEYVANMAADGSKTVTRIKKINETTRVVSQTNDYFTVTGKEKARLDKRGAVMRDAQGNIIFDRKSEKIKINDSEVRDLFNRDGSFNATVYDNVYHSAQGPVMRKKVQAALAKEIIRQKMPNLDFDVADHSFETQEVNILPDNEGIEVIETHSDGSRSTIRVRRGSNERMMVEYTKTDRHGRGKRLSSDGIINRKSTFVTVDDTAGGAIDQSSVSSIYGLTEHYKRYHRRKKYSKIDYDKSLFEATEVNDAREWINGYHESANASMFEFRRK